MGGKAGQVSPSFWKKGNPSLNGPSHRSCLTSGRLGVRGGDLILGADPRLPSTHSGPGHPLSPPRRPQHGQALYGTRGSHRKGEWP